jgi:hypothetical protein
MRERATANMKMIGKRTNIHDTTVNPIEHRKFNTNVQRKMTKMWRKVNAFSPISNAIMLNTK